MEEQAKKEQEKRREQAKYIIKRLQAISNYPAFSTFSSKEEAKEEIIKLYKKGDNITKGMILSYINEKLSLIRYTKDFDSIKSRKEKNKEVSFNEVSKSLFDYSQSLDGITEYLDILSRIDDRLALKILTYHLTRYLTINNSLFISLTNYCIKLLGKSKNLYALNFLLFLYENFGDERFVSLQEVIEALKKWKNKINYIKGSKKEKRILKMRLSKVLVLDNNKITYIR